MSIHIHGSGSIKLYVDDLRACPARWTLARTITEAIRMLCTQNVDEVSLDHDISHAVGMAKIVRPFPCPETFEPIAWFLAATAFPGPVTLHTANPIGAKKMYEILQDAGIKAKIILGLPANGLE